MLFSFSHQKYLEMPQKQHTSIILKKKTSQNNLYPAGFKKNTSTVDFFRATASAQAKCTQHFACGFLELCVLSWILSDFVIFKLRLNANQTLPTDGLTAYPDLPSPPLNVTPLMKALLSLDEAGY